MDFSQLSYNDHTLFHMLRHFEKINAPARNCLLNRGYSDLIIEENLAIPGSKFHEGFASDIKTLVNQFKSGKQIQIQERKKYYELVISFENSSSLNGIGSLGVCNREELSSLNASEPVLKLNRGVAVWHSMVANLPNTTELTLVVKKQNTTFFLITAFPGLPALPIPQKKMNIKELELSKQYWADKVFLEKIKDEIRDKR